MKWNYTTEEYAVYDSIYDMTKKYMDEQNFEIPFSKDVFLCSIGAPADIVDMNKWMEFELTDFITAAYLMLLRRFPSPLDMEHWVTRTDVRRKLIECILSSLEFQMKHIEVLNNPYPINSRKLKLRKWIMGDNSTELRKRWYFKIYIHMPPIIKKIAHAIILGT